MGIHRSPVNSKKWPVTRKMFQFDDVIMISILEKFHHVKTAPHHVEEFTIIYSQIHMVKCHTQTISYEHKSSFRILKKGKDGQWKYRKTSNISCTLVGNTIVDNSGVVGATPAVAVPTASSFSTEHLASMDWAKTTARGDKKHLSFGIWCELYWRF